MGALFDVLSKAIALKPSLKLSRRPCLADWGEYAAAVYEVMGWGAEAFLKDWDEVVKAQNQATLDGSPVAQAIIKFMEERSEYTATSSELHSKLKAVAVTLGVDVERDKAWPKSARWLWRRIQEVLSLLIAAGIEARRAEDRSGTKITLRKTPINDATNATDDENRTGKPETRGNTSGDDATSNATRESADRAESGNRYGNFSERVSEVAAALRQLFDMHPETQKQTPKQIAEDLYIWTDLGYEPDPADVDAALRVVGA